MGDFEMAWLAGQVDYLLFITGLCYMSAGAAALLVRLQNDRSLPWNLFSIPSIGLGVVVWSQLLAYEFGDPSWFVIARSIARFALWAVLLEFGRRVASRRPGVRIPPLFTIVMTTVAALTGLLGLESFTIAMHVLLALPGAVLAVLGMSWADQTRSAGIGAGLRIAAVGMALNAVLLTAVYAVNPAGAAYVSIAGIPASLFTAASALVVFTGLMLYSAFASIEQTGIFSRAAIAKGLSIVPVIVILAIAGLVVASGISRFEANIQGAALTNRARAAAASVEAQNVGRLTATSADVGSTDLATVLDELDRMRFANPDVKSLYIVRRTASGVVVYVAASGSRAATPGTVDQGASDNLRASLKSMTATVEGPLSTPAGDVVSAFGQIRDPHTGAFVGMLGMDISAVDWVRGLASARLTGIGLGALVSLVALFFFSLSQMATYATSASAASESRLRRVLDRAPDGIVLLDGRDWRILEANPRAVDMLETAEDELKGSAFEDLLIPSQTQGLAADANTCSISKGVGEWNLKTPSGNDLAIELTCAPLEFAGGETTLAFLHDVTARKRAEAELHDRITLENLIRAVSSRFIAAEPGDIDRFVADALATFGTFFGVGRTYVYRFTPDLLTMRKTHEWCAEGVAPLDESQTLLPTDESYPWLLERLRNGEFVHIPRVSQMPPEARAEQALFQERGAHSVLIVPMTSGWRASGYLGFDSLDAEREWSGERIALISVLADVFASAMRRARSEEELAKLSLAVTQSPAATVITSSDGTIEYVNPRFRELSGYAIDELVKQNPRILKSGEMPAETYGEMWDTITSGRQWRGELVNRRKNGSLYWVQASISPVRDAQGEIHFVGVQEDISAIKEAEAALSLAADAANAANRAKSDFLATMSHEIRTPMNAIIGMAELLEETPLNDEQVRYVRVFRSAGESLLTLINDVLDLSKIEAGRLELDPREFDVEKVVEETAEVMAVRAREKGIELLSSVGTDVPSRLVGDPDRLRQVLVNLIGNAVKFTSEGHVLVSVFRVEGAGDGVVRLRFSVTDTGIGIPADKVDKVFEAFTQADSSTTRQYGGTGLGLTISVRLVELMGGEISVTSEVGKGSSFMFDATFGPAEACIAEDGVSGLEGVRALVVDDNSANRMIERQYLEGAGASVDEAADGTAALAAVHDAKTPYDIVLLDLRMPEMSGIQVAERLHTASSGHGPSLLVVSSDSRPGDAQRARDAGAHALLMKPVRRRDLVSAVRAAIDGAQVRKAPSVAPKPPESVGEAAALRILLVEDTEDNRLLIQAYLRKTTHVLTMAENGAEAVEAYRKSAPGGFDLILMDMQMPIMDGYAATAEIRRIEKEGCMPHTPIVALTAFALPQEAKSAIDAGCDEYLTKPIKKATLLEALARYAGAEV